MAAKKTTRNKKVAAAPIGYNYKDGAWVPEYLNETTREFMRVLIKEGKSLQEIKELLSRKDQVVTRVYQLLVEDIKHNKKIKAKPLDFNQLGLITLFYNQGKHLDFVLDAVRHTDDQRILISNAYMLCAQNIAPPAEGLQQSLPLPDPASIVQEMSDNDRLTSARAQFDFVLDEIKSVRNGTRAKSESYDLITKATALFAELIS